jgi:carboxymethylenebutenolidase
MDQKVYDLYDDFIHGGMSRRDFLERLSVMVGSTAAATATMSLLQSDFALAQMVPANDPRLAIETITYDWPKGKISAYLARPKAKGKRPAIVVIHENRGLHPHIQDVTRRLAVEGFIALAPDLLSMIGGTPANEDEQLEAFKKINRAEAHVPLVAAVSFMKKHSESTGKVGAVGFCFGGEMVNRLAVHSRELDAGVAYYGRQPSEADTAKITAPLLLHYAENDKGVNAGIEAYEKALKANKKRYTQHIYPGAQHAFNNDTSKARYNKQAADLAWGRTLAFLKETLGAPPNAA